jgi:hypothetical protein
LIVAPDFLDHWRTRMVVDALGEDELAPTYILRLWAHCQTRKADRFAMPAAGLKSQCRFKGDAALFEQALTDAGFVQREGDTVHVLGWAEQNAALIAAWENGEKGGRPSKPKQNPRVTDRKPTGNPDETHGKPNPNPDVTDKSREDKKRPPSTEGENARASRLPKPFELSNEWRTFCKAERPELDPDKVAAKFSDFWHGKPGKAGTKLDWFATWRNWVREERAPKQLTAATGEPAWRTEQRQRTQQAAPGVAVQTPTFFDMEASNVTPHRLG